MSYYEPKLSCVIMHITNACANRCPYCYAHSDDNRICHADYNTLTRIIDELAKAEIHTISFLGGDPALHPHIIDLALYASDKGINSSLMSNTMEIKNCTTERMAQVFKLFEATIHGSCAKDHDSFCRKNGAYDKLVENLKNLTKFNATIGIAINIIPSNSNQVFSMVKSLLDSGVNVSYVIVQRIIPFGAAKNTTEYMLNKEQANNALDEIRRVNEELGVQITVEDPFPLCVIDEKYHKYMHPCEWGYTKAALNGEGLLSRCGADTRYLLGSIFETPINEIWDNSPILKSFREQNYLAEECKTCKLRNQCGGGCPLSCEVSGDHGLDYLYTVYHT